MRRLTGLVAQVRRSGIDSWTLVALSTLVAVLSGLGLAGGKLATSVSIALLGLIGALLLRQEANRDARSPSGEAIADAVAARLRAQDKELRFEYPDLRAALSEAAQIDVVAGLSLSTTVGQYLGDLRAAASRGVMIRLVCPDPSCDEVVALSLARSVQRTRPEHVTHDVVLHLDYALSLRAVNPEIYIGTVRALPAFGIVRIVSTEGAGQLFVKLMSFKVGAGQFPVVQFRKATDVAWWDYFSEQAELFVASSSEYKTPTGGS